MASQAHSTHPRPSRRSLFAAGPAIALGMAALPAAAVAHPDAHLFALEKEVRAASATLDAIYDALGDLEEEAHRQVPFPALVNVAPGDRVLFPPSVIPQGRSWAGEVYSLHPYTSFSPPERIARAKALIDAVEQTRGRRRQWLAEHGEADLARRCEEATAGYYRLLNAVDEARAQTLGGFVVKARVACLGLCEEEKTPLLRQLAELSQ